MMKIHQDVIAIWLANNFTKWSYDSNKTRANFQQITQSNQRFESKCYLPMASQWKSFTYCRFINGKCREWKMLSTNNNKKNERKKKQWNQRLYPIQRQHFCEISANVCADDDGTTNGNKPCSWPMRIQWAQASRQVYN